MTEVNNYEVTKNKEIGLRVYGHRLGLTAFDGCRASSLIAPIEKNNTEKSTGGIPVLTDFFVLKAYAEELIKVITDIDDSHPLIMMGCPSWDQRIDLVADDPITCYDNLMYTVHFYAATHKQELRDASDYAIAKGIPVFISECGGCEASGNGPIDDESMKEWSDWAAANGVSILMWSISDKDETCSMFTPDATSEGPWPEEVIKPWGRMAMSIIGK